MNYLKNILYGILLGISNIIPGLSAGTIAVVLGIYNKLISSLREDMHILKSSIFENKKEEKNFLFKIILNIIKAIVKIIEKERSFLFMLLIGILIAGLTFSKLFLLMNNVQLTIRNFIFLGLLIGTIPFIFKESGIRREIKKDRKRAIYIIFGIISFAFMLIIYYLAKANNISNLPYNIPLNFKNICLIILVGIVGAFALVVPGISGSSMLIILGYYNIIIKAVANFNFIILLPFTIGIIIGIAFATIIMDYLLKKYFTQTYMAIVGFVLGSIPLMVPKILNNMLSECIISCILGVLISYLLLKLKYKRHNQDN